MRIRKADRYQRRRPIEKPPFQGTSNHNMFAKHRTPFAGSTTLMLYVGLAMLSRTTDCGAQTSAAESGQTAPQNQSQSAANHPEVAITFRDDHQVLTGRIITQTTDGQILLEEPNGSYTQLLASTILQTEETGRPFASFNAAQTGAHLKQLMGQGDVTRTQHFVICSAASPRYTDFCGQLLERVAAQFPATLKKAGIQLPALPQGMAVMIFATSADLQSFAKKQHPEVDFSDTPGYYSVTHNQILFSADMDDRNARTNSEISRTLKRTPRIIETMVHETVHLLQYNSGLMNRFAANPTWLAEGMAVYFEPASLRSSLLWNRAGDTNQLHLEGLKAAARGPEFKLPLQTLLTDDQTFANSNTVRSAYAESWAITWTLMKRHPEAYGRLLNAQKELQPLVAVTSQQRLKAVADLLEMSVQDLEAEVRKAFRRQL